MKIKSIFSRHAGESRYLAVSTDTYGDPASWRGVTGKRGFRIKHMMTVSILALFITIPAFATDPDPVAQKTVASKAYVDTKQDKITTGLVEFDDAGTTATVPALVVTNATGTALNGNTIGFLDLNTYYNLNNDLDELPDTMVPSIGLLQSKVEDVWNGMPYWTALTWNSAETTSTNAYDITFVGDTGATANAWPSADKTKLINTAALAQGLALKQNKITTGLVEFDYFQTPYNLPAITTFDTTSGLVANKIGILDQASIENTFGLYTLPEMFEEGMETEFDKLVPTVTAAMGIYRELHDMIDRKQYKLPAAWTGTTDTSNLGSTGGQTIGLTTTEGIVGRRYITAGGSQPLTQKTGADNVILYINGTKTLAQYQTSNFGGTGNNATENQNYIKGALVSLELLKDVYSEITTLKQNKLSAKYTGNAAPKGNQAVVLNTAGNPSNVYTTAGKDLALTAKSGAEKVMNYIDGTTASATFATSQGLTEIKVKSALVSLELLKDVYGELNSKITNNALPTGTTGTVVTYNGTNATTGVQEFGERAVYDPANTYNASTDATKLATMASVKYECAGYEAGHENDPDYCWLWALPN